MQFYVQCLKCLDTYFSHSDDSVGLADYVNPDQTQTFCCWNIFSRSIGKSLGQSLGQSLGKIPI